jgi:voltage-gated potassium channel
MKLKHRFGKFLAEILAHTPFAQMTVLLVVLWIAFAGILFLAERASGSTVIQSFGDALYWGVAAMSTAGIADTPISGMSKLVGAIWIITGSVLFFGIIVATVTAYFMRPLQRPASQLVDTIEYNLEQLDALSIEELDLLKDTVDTLIEHVERLKEQRLSAGS